MGQSIGLDADVEPRPVESECNGSEYSVGCRSSIMQSPCRVPRKASNFHSPSAGPSYPAPIHTTAPAAPTHNKPDSAFSISTEHNPSLYAHIPAIKFDDRAAVQTWKSLQARKERNGRTCQTVPFVEKVQAYGMPPVLCYPNYSQRSLGGVPALSRTRGHRRSGTRRRRGS
jgi:hypothetical protein